MAKAQKDLMRQMGRILRATRELQGHTQGTMAQIIMVSRPKIGQWENGVRLPSAREDALNAIKGYRLSRYQAVRLIRLCFPAEPLSSKEWRDFGNPNPLLLETFDPKIGNYLSNLLTAKQIDKNMVLGNPRQYRKEKMSVSALFTNFSAYYDIGQNGYFMQKVEIQMFQFTSTQVILTPIFIDHIPKSVKIEWNSMDMVKMGKVHEEPRELCFLDSIKTSGKEPQAVCFKGTIAEEDVPIGLVNTLYVEVESRLPICTIQRDTLAFCIPVFYALNPSRISISLPDGGLDNLEFYLLKRLINNKSVKWGDPATRITPKTESHDVCLFEIEAVNNDVQEKRFCPDLLVARFKKPKTNDVMQHIVALSKEEERTPQVACSFFCGHKQFACPSLRQGMT